MKQDLYLALKTVLGDIGLFCERGGGIRLRRYQQEVARVIVDSVLQRRGLSIVVMFPRQSGKNELQAQVEAYLLTLLSQTDAEIVKVSPTWRPQSLNAMRRLERVLSRNLITRSRWKKETGYIYRLGRARVIFLSGAPEANIVGATASTLLEVDEAQDVPLVKFDKDIAPMAASTDATRVFWGTAWTAQTLLGRELRAARQAEQQDGRRRVFTLTADEVAAEVPAYGKFVAGQVARLGRSHPMVRTQFYSEEIDAAGGMFPPERLALMRGSQRRSMQPPPGEAVYALLLDVAGEDEGAAGTLAGGTSGETLANPQRDATALTIVQVGLASQADPLIAAPTYRVMDRRLWLGARHTRLYAELRALAELWNPQWVVVDATGVGAGLASFLEKALPGRVIPYLFNAATKSKLGWEFLAVIETGRFQDYSAGRDPEQALFFRQLAACQMEVLPGPERRLKWGVPDGSRDPVSGELLHDDLVLSAALVAVLDKQKWTAAGPALIVSAADPLKDLDRGF